MLAEMPVSELTLNELSRRAGLAKSNVLRYFESREAVLLELLDAAWQDWLLQLDLDLMGAVEPAVPVAVRCRELAAAVAASLAARPVLCDLISAQAAVLEHNVSPQVAAQYKRAAMTGIAVLTAGALWPHTQPSAAMLAAYQADPELAALRLDFTATLGEMLEVMSAGLLTRGDRDDR